ncbi:hypothetical protein K2173_021254 [Erythroxylum novogranatense]|uniref:Uncharacterized protein n=1 Tax=Erythroxylum novogranatense TaxID=1862640 RepID=A0AAV8TQY8_9ROSI|nr:hypothetical protein K2173_021254 [Erythroxylum novogranatense]
MSSMLCSQGMVLATAMAVSGTVILLALRLQKSLPVSQFPIYQIPPSTPQQVLRPCISSDGERKKKKKKRVHFAEDVVDPRGDGEEFRKQQAFISAEKSSPSSSSSSSRKMKKNGGHDGQERQMPANRVALYNGILRDRVVHRLAYPY